MARKTKKNRMAEAIERLHEETLGKHTEGAHIMADTILCDLLIQIGCRDVVSAYRKVRKHYSYKRPLI